MDGVYLLFYCDEWKSTSSLELVGAYSSDEQLFRAVRLCIDSGTP